MHTPTPTPVSTTPVTTETPYEDIPLQSFEVIGPTDVFINDQYYLIIKRVPEDANEKLVYTANRDDLCKINENGVFSTYASGTVRFTVRTEDKRLSQTVTVYIHNYVTDLKIDYPSSVKVGQTFTITCEVLPAGLPNKGLYWVNEKGSNGEYEGVISISIASDKLSCTVTALKAGTGCITIGSEDFPDSVHKTIFFTVKE